MCNAAPQSEYLTVALAAAARAADISRAYYRGNLTVTTKADRTPVTEADIECEEAIRTIILDAFPGHGFYGEETGQTRADADFLWLVDPIDGTKGFVRQYPFFSTQIALMRNGELILGVSSDPDRAAVSTGNLRSLASSDGWSALGDLLARADRTRGYGDFYHYHLLAAGKIEAVVESDVNILDIAALAVIVSEAGGVFTDLNGDAPGLETRSVLAANPAVHATYLDRLKGYVT